MHLRPLTAVAIAWALASCTAIPEQTPRDLELDAPSQLGTGTGPGALWWRDFGSEALDAVVEAALTHNRDLDAAIARLDAAAARAGIVGSELWPRLEAGPDLRRQRLNFIGLPIPGSSGVTSVTTSQFAASLNLSWEVDLWGRVRAASAAAEADLAAATEDLRGAQLSLAARTARAWFACVEARQQLELAEATAGSFARTEEMVRERFERGVRPALDFRLARSDHQEARALVELRRRQLDDLVRQLQVLTGRYPDSALEPAAGLPSLPGPVPGGLSAELVRRRPDLAAAEHRLAATDALLASSRANLYPRIALTSSAGTSSNDLADLGDLDFRVWSIGANLFAPLLDGGRIRADIDEKDARRREALALFGSTALQAYREVETALAATPLLDAEWERRSEAVAEAEAARTLSEDRYARGLVPIDTLLNAQRRALAARTQFLAVARQRLDNRVQLILALGGGFDAGDPSAAPPTTAHP
ncbi:MAG: efflux transporter outer membrane subunit [Planctomycetota bacterium]